MAVSTVLLAACHFESDKDYKTKEGTESADSTHKNAHEDDQHNPSKPPVDAARQSDSSLHTPTPAGNDSSVKKDSSRGDKPAH